MMNKIDSTGGPRYMRSFYLRFRIYVIHKSINLYPLIYSNPWSFYMGIYYMRAYFWSPYLSHVTRSTCIVFSPTVKIHFVHLKPEIVQSKVSYFFILLRVWSLKPL